MFPVHTPPRPVTAPPDNVDDPMAVFEEPPPPPRRVVRKLIPVPTIDVDIDTAQQRMLIGLIPDLPSKLKRRIAASEDEIKAKVEDARLDSSVPFKRFALKIKQLLTLIAALKHELARHEPEAVKTSLDVNERLFDIVASVRRWSDYEYLKTTRATLENQAATAYWHYHAELERYGRGQGPPPTTDRTAREIGVCLSDDELARHLTTALEGRLAACGMLKALGCEADRAKSVAKALDDAGTDAVIRAIVPTRTVDDPRPTLGLEIQSLRYQRDGTDPATDQYARLSAVIANRESEYKAAGPIVLDLQLRASKALIDRAKAGNLSAVHEVEQIVSRVPALSALADALSECRGTRAHCMVALIEYLKPAPLPSCSSCGRK